MTVTAGDISLDEAADHALARLGMTYEQSQDMFSYDCRNGHFDCAVRSGGACFNEAIAESAGILARERNAALAAVAAAADTLENPAPEDIILLTLAGDDEPTDEMVALADRIINDLNLAGFQLSRDGVPGTFVGECDRCGEDVRSDEQYLTNADDPAWVQHERCYDDDPE